MRSRFYGDTISRARVQKKKFDVPKPILPGDSADQRGEAQAAGDVIEWERVRRRRRRERGDSGRLPGVKAPACILPYSRAGENCPNKRNQNRRRARKSIVKSRNRRWATISDQEARLG